ncbi:TPA: AbrB family transcriptional regulator [Bacillus cereus]
MKSNIKDPIEIFTAEDAIIFRKYKANMTCMVTGDVSTQNVSFFDGKIIVSPKGAELLVKELDKFIVSEK